MADRQQDDWFCPLMQHDGRRRQSSSRNCLHVGAEANPQSMFIHFWKLTVSCQAASGFGFLKMLLIEWSQPFALLSSRRRQGSAGSRWELVSNLHGRHHRLRAAGVWPHGHLHQMREEDERVPHLQAVRGPGRARLQVLNRLCGIHDLWGRTTEHGASSSFVPQQAGSHFTVREARLFASCTWFASLFLLILH